MHLTSDDQQLNLLLKLICESVNTKIELNSKLLRDILDVIEGLMRGALNSKGKYDHSTLKIKCSYISLQAFELQQRMTNSQLLKLTHREHAIPLKVLLGDLYRIKNPNIETLKVFLNDRLVSVLITKDEQILLDSHVSKIKSQMPLNWDGYNPFARFKVAGIKIMKRSFS